MTWKDITIEKYYRIMALRELYTEDMDIIINTLAILEDTTPDRIEGLPWTVVQAKARGLRFLNKQPVPTLIRKTYTLDGKKYAAILNPENLTTAQYIDFQMKANSASEDIAGLLAVILIPEGHTYNEGYSQKDVAEAISKHMSIEDALGISGFFFHLCRVLTKRLLRRNARNIKALRKKERKQGLTQEERRILEITTRINDLNLYS